MPQRVDYPSGGNGETAEFGAEWSTTALLADELDCSSNTDSKDEDPTGKNAAVTGYPHYRLTEDTTEKPSSVATTAAALVSLSPSQGDDDSSSSGAMQILNKTSSEERVGASPGEDAPWVPQRYGIGGDNAVEESPATSIRQWSTPFGSRLWKAARSEASPEALAPKDSSVGAASVESQDKKNWQKQIEQVNANAQSSPSFVKLPRRCRQLWVK